MQKRGSFNAVTGTVTFAGAAAGKYALVDSLNDTAEGGHWTAEASLTAKFGSQAASGTADDQPGTISGAITNFMTGDMEQDWMVALLSTPLNPWVPADGLTAAVLHFDTSCDRASSGYVARAHTGTVWSMGDRDAAADGNWSGTFYVGVDKEGSQRRHARRCRRRVPRGV